MAAFGCGVVFAIGLGISGMTLPQNILAFLDLAHWKPDLLFVMAAAVLVYGVGFRLVTRRAAPVLASSFEIPTSRVVTWRLVAGSTLFGVGWGLGGFCGGPAFASLVAAQSEVLVFLAAMLLGMWSCRRLSGP